MSLDVEQFREQLLDICEGKITTPYPLLFSGDGEWTSFYDSIEALLISGDEEWIDTAGLFISKFSVQISKSEMGRGRLEKWLPLLASGGHHDSLRDTVIVRESLVPSAPR